MILDYFKYILLFFDNFDNVYFLVWIFVVLIVYKILVGLLFLNLLVYKSVLIEILVIDYIYFSRIFVWVCLKVMFVWWIELGVLVGY